MKRRPKPPTDIADALKAKAFEVFKSKYPWEAELGQLLNEAADEIEKLRVAIIILEQQVENMGYEHRERR